MRSVDTNLLLYSLNPASSRHARARGFLSRIFKDPSMRVALSDYVLVELYTLLRNPTVTLRPLSGEAARDVVLSFLKFRNVMRIEHARVMDEVWEIAGREGFARRRIYDLRLGLTLVRSGVTEFATANVKDFEALGFARVWNPLLEEEVTGEAASGGSALFEG